jgi:hypothetical protein
MPFTRACRDSALECGVRARLAPCLIRGATLVLANLLDPAAASKRSSITKAAVLADQLDEIGGPLLFDWGNTWGNAVMPFDLGSVT